MIPLKVPLKTITALMRSFEHSAEMSARRYKRRLVRFGSVMRGKGNELHVREKSLSIQQVSPSQMKIFEVKKAAYYLRSTRVMLSGLRLE